MDVCCRLPCVVCWQFTHDFSWSTQDISRFGAPSSGVINVCLCVCVSAYVLKIACLWSSSPAAAAASSSSSSLFSSSFSKSSSSPFSSSSPTVVIHWKASPREHDMMQLPRTSWTRNVGLHFHCAAYFPCVVEIPLTGRWELSRDSGIGPSKNVRICPCIDGDWPARDGK